MGAQGKNGCTGRHVRSSVRDSMFVYSSISNSFVSFGTEEDI
jgi:hypothetical protein